MIRIGAAFVAAALLICPVSIAKADQPGPDWMPAHHVIEKLLKSGYSQISKIEADDDRWEGKGIKNGQKMDFHVDPKTGEITSEKKDD